MSRILDNNGNWIDNQDGMEKEAVEFFKAQFTEEKVPTNFDIVHHIPRMVIEEQNTRL